jgi:hypothetical protein
LKQHRSPPAEKSGGWGILSWNGAGKGGPAGPRAIIESLDLRRPIYKKTAAYGHFGRNDPDFTWEKTDKAAKLASDAGVGAAVVARK